jgi:hypothetical protein
MGFAGGESLETFYYPPNYLCLLRQQRACCFTITLARIVGLILNISKEIGRHSHYAG